MRKLRIYIDTSVVGGCFDKEFNCVKLMRNIRNKIHEKYKNNPELRKIELERIKKQRNFNIKQKKNNN